MMCEADLRGRELIEAVKNHPTLLKDSLQGFADIEAGNNTVITVGELMESLENGEPII